MKVTVLGSGRWASFMAWYQAEILGNEVLMYGRATSAAFAELRDTRKNEFLGLGRRVSFTTELKAAIEFSDYIIVSISAQGMPKFSEGLAKLGARDKVFILAMKGLVDETGERLSEVLEKHVGENNKIVVWVGPGHVQDFVAGKSNVMVLGGERAVCCDVIGKFKSDLIKFYQSVDVLGCEVGAAAKNVLGIVAGFLDGMGLSCLKGALMVRGLSEVSRLVGALGGEIMTPYGLSSLGDFEATLFSAHSNNYNFGLKMARGEEVSDKLCEGVGTGKALRVLAEKFNVDMPISRMLYNILFESKDPREGLRELFMRGNLKEFRHRE